MFKEDGGCACRDMDMTYQRISRVGTGLGDQNELFIVRSCNGLRGRRLNVFRLLYIHGPRQFTWTEVIETNCMEVPAVRELEKLGS